MTSELAYRDTQYSRMLAGLGTFIVFGLGIAVGAVFGGLSRVSLWLLGMGAVLILLRQTRLTVAIDAAGFGIGRATLPWEFVQRVEVLEGSAMRAAISTDAHPQDFLRLRSTTAGVRIWLDDPSDPHRAWTVSVRDPKALRRVLDGLHERRSDRV